MKYIIFALMLLFVSTASEARSSAQKRAFAKQVACPATGKHTVSCKGYVIDHIKPLCAGGLDKSTNMQWQLLAASYKKDAKERSYCKCLKSNKPNSVCVLSAS